VWSWACIGKLPTGNISTGYQKQRKKDTSPRRKVSKVNLWFRKCVLRGVVFFHTHSADTAGDKWIHLVRIFGVRSRKTSFQLKSNIFFSHCCRPPDPNFGLPIREKLYRWRILTLHVRFTKRRQYDFFFFIFLFTWRPSANPQCQKITV